MNPSQLMAVINPDGDPNNLDEALICQSEVTFINLILVTGFYILLSRQLRVVIVIESGDTRGYHRGRALIDNLYINNLKQLNCD